MRGDPDVRALVEERVERREEAAADLVGIVEGDRERLDVDALAEPDVGEARDVGERPPQVGLEHDPDVLVPGRANLAIELQRRVGHRGVLHVDPHEVAARGRVGEQRLEVRAADLGAELEPEARQLHRDVRVEPLALDPLERGVVGGRDLAGLGRGRDLLAEDVDGRGLALGVQPPHDANRVVERRPGDVRRREPAHDRARHGGQRAGDRLVEERHGRDCTSATRTRA